jgi:hypothetical protein
MPKIKFVVKDKKKADDKPKKKIKFKVKPKIKKNIVGKASLYFNPNDDNYKEGGYMVDRHEVNGNTYKEFKGKYYKYGDAKGRYAKETSNPYTRKK